MAESRVRLDSDVRAYLEAAPEAYLRCRLFTHNWEPTHALGTHVVENEGRRDEMWTTHLECQRCGLTAVDYRQPYSRERIRPRAIDYSTTPGYLSAGIRVSKEDILIFLEERNGRGSRARRRSPRPEFRVAV